MSEQLQTKDNFLTIFSELNTQIKSLTENNNILKTNLYDNQTAPDVKTKLNHYTELFKDNAFMKKIIKQKETLIKKLKQERKEKRVNTMLSAINGFIKILHLLRNVEENVKRRKKLEILIDSMRKVSERSDLSPSQQLE